MSNPNTQEKESVTIRLADLQAGKVHVLADNGAEYKLQQSMKVGMYTLMQVPMPATHGNQEELQAWMEAESPKVESVEVEPEAESVIVTESLFAGMPNELVNEPAEEVEPEAESVIEPKSKTLAKNSAKKK